MGFDHVATAPPFAPGPAGDLFLAGDLEFAHPVFAATNLAHRDIAIPGALGAHAGADERAGPPKTDEVVGHLARMSRTHGLGLLLDVVLDRIDAKGALASANPELFKPSGPDRPDPRWIVSPKVAIARFTQPDCAKTLLAMWGSGFALCSALAPRVSAFSIPAACRVRSGNRSLPFCDMHFRKW